MGERAKYLRGSMTSKEDLKEDLVSLSYKNLKIINNMQIIEQ